MCRLWANSIDPSCNNSLLIILQECSKSKRCARSMAFISHVGDRTWFVPVVVFDDRTPTSQAIWVDSVSLITGPVKRSQSTAVQRCLKTGLSCTRKNEWDLCSFTLMCCLDRDVCNVPLSLFHLLSEIKLRTTQKSNDTRSNTHYSSPHRNTILYRHHTSQCMKKP